MHAEHLGHVLRMTALRTAILLAAGMWLLSACERSRGEGDAQSGTAVGDTNGPAGAVAGWQALGSPQRVIDSIRAPESVAIGPDGRYYVSSFGEFGKGNDGAVFAVDPGTRSKTPYVRGLVDPTGITFRGDTLYVVDRGGVFEVPPGGKARTLVPASRFPRRTYFLNDVAVDRNGDLLVSDTGNERTKGGGGVFRISRDGSVSLLGGGDSVRAAASANGVLVGPDGTMYVVGYRSGALASTDGRGSWREIASGMGSPDGLVFDRGGRLIVTDNVGGDVFVLDSVAAGVAPRRIAQGLKSPADLVIDEARGWLVIPENGGNRLSLYSVPR